MDTAFDVILAQRQDDNTGNYQRNVPGIANTVIGFDSNRRPTAFPFPTPSATGNYLLSGGTVTSPGGLVVEVSPSEYLIQGVYHSIPTATSLTAAAADATFSRVDVVVVDDTNTVSILAGIPSANPIKPQPDPTTQLELTSYILAAGSTSLPFTLEQIYLENTEWTTAKIGVPINLASTVNPRRGLLSIQGIASVVGDLWTFTAPADFDLGAYTALGFYVAPTSNWPNAKQWTIQWLNIANATIGNPVVLKHGTFNFVATGMTPNLYQQIVIPTSLFGLNGNPNTRILRMAVQGGTSNISFNLDDVFLSNGLDPTAPVAPQVIGTANEVTVNTVANIATVSLPAALTFTGKTVTGGRFVLPASTTSSDFLVLAHGVAPTTPTNGALWSTTAGFFGQVNGATVGPFGVAGAGATPAGADTQVQYNNSGAMGASAGLTFTKSAAAPGLSVNGTGGSYIQVISTGASADVSFGAWRNTTAGTAFTLYGTTSPSTSWRLGVFTTAAGAAAVTDYTIIYNNGGGNTRLWSMDITGIVTMTNYFKDNVAVNGASGASLSITRPSASSYAFTNYITGATNWRTGLHPVAAGALADTDYNIFYNNGGGNARYFSIDISGVVSIPVYVKDTLVVQGANAGLQATSTNASGGTATLSLVRAGVGGYAFVHYVTGSTGWRTGTHIVAAGALADTDFNIFYNGGSGNNRYFSIDITGVIRIGSAALPTSPGASGNVMTSNGTNWVSQAPAGGGSGTITSSSVGQIPVYTAATTIAGSSALTYSASALNVTGTISSTGAIFANGANNTYVATFISPTGQVRIKPYYDATYGTLIDSADTATGAVAYPLTLIGSIVRQRIGATDVTTVTSAGLDVVGVTTSTGRFYTTVSTAAFDCVSATPTAASYMRLQNGAGDLYIGLDSSTSSTFGTAGNYGTVIYRPASTIFSLSRGGAIDLTFSATGHATFGGNITASGSYTSSSAIQVVADYTSSASDPYIKITSDAGATQVFLQASTGSGSVGTITNQPFTIRSFNTLVASFGSTLITIPSGSLVVSGVGNIAHFTGAGPGWLMRSASDTSDAAYLDFRTGGDAVIGSIKRVGASSAVVYNTSSDSRLKVAITNFEGSDSGPLIDALQPRKFNWRNVPGPSGHGHVGFIAQEMALADPIFAKIGAVSIGDSDPNPNNITIVWQRSDIVLIPILVAEIKALRARVALLETFNPP